MKDIQGIERGKCNKQDCECEEYRPPPVDKTTGKSAGLRCEYCDHTPAEHVKIIALGGCKKCGGDNCSQYESEKPTSYSDCQYCGCEAQCHVGADKLFKKSAQVSPGAGTGISMRTDSSGMPAQTDRYGLCKFPGCKYPRSIEGNHVHEFCSRTCAEKFSKSHSQLPQVGKGFPPPASPSIAFYKACEACRTRPANPGHAWCERCFAMAKSQKH